MPEFNDIRRPLLALAAGAGVFAFAPACSNETPEPTAADTGGATGETADEDIREDVYTGVRGLVVSLPQPGNPASELRIRHEHIPTFRNKDGEIGVNARGVPGMAAMEMPFPVADGLDISGMSVGDTIAFDFTVRWGVGPSWFITRYEVLDPGTELDFTNRDADGNPIGAPAAP